MSEETEGRRGIPAVIIESDPDAGGLAGLLPFLPPPEPDTGFRDSSGRSMPLNAETAEILNRDIDNAVENARSDGYEKGYQEGLEQCSNKPMSEEEVVVPYVEPPLPPDEPLYTFPAERVRIEDDNTSSIEGDNFSIELDVSKDSSGRISVVPIGGKRTIEPPNNPGGGKKPKLKAGNVTSTVVDVLKNGEDKSENKGKKKEKKEKEQKEGKEKERKKDKKKSEKKKKKDKEEGSKTKTKKVQKAATREPNRTYNTLSENLAIVEQRRKAFEKRGEKSKTEAEKEGTTAPDKEFVVVERPHRDDLSHPSWVSYQINNVGTKKQGDTMYVSPTGKVYRNLAAAKKAIVDKIEPSGPDDITMDTSGFGGGTKKTKPVSEPKKVATTPKEKKKKQSKPLITPPKKTKKVKVPSPPKPKTPLVEPTGRIEEPSTSLSCESCGNPSPELQICGVCEKRSCTRCMIEGFTECLDCEKDRLSKIKVEELHRGLWDKMRVKDYVRDYLRTLPEKVESYSSASSLSNEEEDVSNEESLHMPEIGSDESIGGKIRHTGDITKSLPFKLKGNQRDRERNRLKHEIEQSFPSETHNKHRNKSKKRSRTEREAPSYSSPAVSREELETYETKVIRQTARNMRVKLKSLEKIIESNRKQMVLTMSGWHTMTDRGKDWMSEDYRVHQRSSMATGPGYGPAYGQPFLDQRDSWAESPLCRTFSDRFLISVLEYFKETFLQIRYKSDDDTWFEGPPPWTFYKARVEPEIVKVYEGYDKKRRGSKGYAYQEEPGVLGDQRWEGIRSLGMDFSFSYARQMAFKLAASWMVAHRSALNQIFRNSFFQERYGSNPPGAVYSALKHSIVSGTANASQLLEYTDAQTIMLGLGEMELDFFAFTVPDKLRAPPRMTDRTKWPGGWLLQYKDWETFQKIIQGDFGEPGDDGKYTDKEGIEYVDPTKGEDFKSAWDNLLEARRSHALVTGTYSISQDKTCNYGFLVCALQPSNSNTLVSKYNDDQGVALGSVRNIDRKIVEDTDRTLGQALMGEGWHSSINSYIKALGAKISPSRRTMQTSLVTGSLEGDYDLLKVPKFYEKFVKHTYKQFVIEHLGGSHLRYDDLKSFDSEKLSELVPVLFRVAMAMPDEDWDLPNFGAYGGLTFPQNEFPFEPKAYNFGIDYERIGPFSNLSYPPSELAEEYASMHWTYMKDMAEGFPLMYFKRYEAVFREYFVEDSANDFQFLDSTLTQKLSSGELVHPMRKVLEAYKILVALKIAGRYLTDLRSEVAEERGAAPNTTVANSMLGREVSEATCSLIGITNYIDWGFNPNAEKSFNQMKNNKFASLSHLCSGVSRETHENLLRATLYKKSQKEEVPYYQVLLEFLGKVRTTWYEGLGLLDSQGEDEPWDSDAALVKIASGTWEAKWDSLTGKTLKLLFEYEFVEKDEFEQENERKTREVYKEFWVKQLGLTAPYFFERFDIADLYSIQLATRALCWIAEWKSPKEELHIWVGYVAALSATFDEMDLGSIEPKGPEDLLDLIVFPLVDANIDYPVPGDKIVYQPHEGEKYSEDTFFIDEGEEIDENPKDKEDAKDTETDIYLEEIEAWNQKLGTGTTFQKIYGSIE